MGNRTALKDAWSSAVTRANVTLAVGFGCAVSWSPTLLTAATPDNVMNALVNKPPHGACMPSLVAAVLACLVLFLAAGACSQCSSASGFTVRSAWPWRSWARCSCCRSSRGTPSR